MTCRVVEFAGHDPKENLAAEEELFKQLRHKPEPVCLFYVNDPCVVLGRSNKEDMWVNRDAMAHDPIPLIRRFSGGGAVYHDRDNLNYSLLMPMTTLEGHATTGASSLRPLRYIDWLRAVLLDALGNAGTGFTKERTSDIFLNGKKISGNALRIASNLVLMHGTLMHRCPLNAIEKYLKIPPDRAGVLHDGFVTGLHEEGIILKHDQTKEWIVKSTCAAIGKSWSASQTNAR